MTRIETTQETTDMSTCTRFSGSTSMIPIDMAKQGDGGVSLLLHTPKVFNNLPSKGISKLWFQS